MRGWLCRAPAPSEKMSFSKGLLLNYPHTMAPAICHSSGACPVGKGPVFPEAGLGLSMGPWSWPCLAPWRVSSCFLPGTELRGLGAPGAKSRLWCRGGGLSLNPHPEVLLRCWVHPEWHGEELWPVLLPRPVLGKLSSGPSLQRPRMGWVWGTHGEWPEELRVKRVPVCWLQRPGAPLSSLSLSFPFRLMKNMPSRCLSAIRTCPQEVALDERHVISQLSCDGGLGTSWNGPCPSAARTSRSGVRSQRRGQMCAWG